MNLVLTRATIPESPSSLSRPLLFSFRRVVAVGGMGASRIVRSARVRHDDWIEVHLRELELEEEGRYSVELNALRGFG